MTNNIINQESLENGRAIIKDLVARFKSNESFYTSKQYKEEVKVEFINPLMEALRWDVDNKQGLGLNFKELILKSSSRWKTNKST